MEQKATDAIGLLGTRELTLEIARTQAELRQGLAGRSQIEPDHGMLFVFPWAGMTLPFTVEKMLVPIDIIFLDQDFKIVWLFENAQPGDTRPYKSKFPYKYVVEVPGGTYKRNATDRIAIISPGAL